MTNPFRLLPYALASALLAACAAPATDTPVEFVEVPSSDAPATGFTPPVGEGPMVYVVSPADGSTVDTMFRVLMAVRGYGIAPAGIERDGTGHLHVLIDADPPAVGEVIPGDAANRHFGGGQTETMLTLPPGEHVLRLVLGDHLHRVIGPELISAPVRVTVRTP